MIMLVVSYCINSLTGGHICIQNFMSVDKKDSCIEKSYMGIVRK